MSDDDPIARAAERVARYEYQGGLLVYAAQIESIMRESLAPLLEAARERDLWYCRAIGMFHMLPDTVKAGQCRETADEAKRLVARIDELEKALKFAQDAILNHGQLSSAGFRQLYERLAALHPRKSEQSTEREEWAKEDA